MGFLESHGRSFPKQDVVIIRGLGTDEEARTTVRAMIQAASGFFNLDCPIFDGDSVEVPDPRGGTRLLYVRKVDIHDTTGASGLLASMGHIEAHWGTAPSKRPVTPRTTFNISGGVNQLAWDNQVVHQSQGVQWPDDLTEVLRKIIEEAPKLKLDKGDLDILLNDAEAAATSIEAGEPAAARRRWLVAIKGVLGDIASGAAQGAGQGAMAWAQSALGALN